MHSYGVTNFECSLVWYISVGWEISLQPDTNSCSQWMLWNTPCSCRRRDTDINGQTDRLKIDRETDTDRHTDQNIIHRHRHWQKHRHTCTRHTHTLTRTCTHVHADTDEHCVYHIYLHTQQDPVLLTFQRKHLPDHRNYRGTHWHCTPMQRL